MTVLELKDYNIYIGDADLELSRIIQTANYSKVAILVDENTRLLCLPILLKGLNEETIIIEIPSGELHKNLKTCQSIWTQMMQEGLDRHSLLINLGGGVIGDMGGFCAASYLRGIDFIQIPTTLLSQVDASIGGKVGIDFNKVKNSIGAFKNPQAVFINPIYLKTLPKCEIRSGFAEIFKHALIADANLWKDLQNIDNLSDTVWDDILIRSLRIKQQIVEQDPLERGLRKALNFGHTIGHAIESFSFGTQHPLLHGDAVAIGIICESWLSGEQGSLSEKSLQSIVQFISKYYPKYTFRKTDFDALFSFMKKDKKNRDGEINFTFISEIGKMEINQICNRRLIEESLLYYLSIAS